MTDAAARVICVNPAGAIGDVRGPVVLEVGHVLVNHPEGRLAIPWARVLVVELDPPTEAPPKPPHVPWSGRVLQ